MKLYDFHESGNGYKVRLLLGHLGIAHERIELDILKGETRTPAFLAKNPNGRIPALELDSGEVLCESNAILFYLAEGTPYLPDDRLDRARVLQWMFFEQYSHEPYIAVLRFWHFSGQTETYRDQIAEKEERGHQALTVMESHLKSREFLVGGRYSIADIALFAYTHVAEEGGFELSAYPAVSAWIARIQRQPGHREITEL